MSLDAVLFDMDGLLVDTEPLWFEAEERVMARMGTGWSPGDQLTLIGGSLPYAVAYMHAKAAEPAEPETIGKWLIAEMVSLITTRGVNLLPGAGPLLAEVAAARFPHALVTSAERDIMNAVLAVTGARFPVTLCGEDVARGKPDPEPYLRAAATLEVAPGRCVVLEDSPNGVAAGDAAGCVVIAVPSTPGLVYPDRPGRITLPSLAGLDLAGIRQLTGLG